jgi:hypothetical protein
LKRGSKAIRDGEGAVAGGDGVRESGGFAEDGGTVGSELGDGLRGKIRKDGDVDGDFVVEETGAAADGGAIIGGRSVNEAKTRCDVDGIRGKAVVVEAQTEIEDEAGVDLPTVLYEKSEIVGCGRGWK